MMVARNKRVCIHTEEEILGIRAAACAAASVRDRISQAICPGMTTLQIDRLAQSMIAETGGTSAFLGYRGFPGQICISVNDEVVHGIGRDDCIIQPGDLVSLDVGVRLDGCVGDTALSVSVGPPSPTVAKLLEGTRKSLEDGIAAAQSGRPVNAIGSAVEKTVHSYGLSVVRDFVGHGCGIELHEPPEVPNFDTGARTPRLKPGMVLAIEPMVNAGKHTVRVEADGWTVKTVDSSPSAHFEHMILITNDEPEILTWAKTR